MTDNKSGKRKPVPSAARAKDEAYEAPKLRVYGAAASLTRRVGNKGTVADGGRGRRSKTS